MGTIHQSQAERASACRLCPFGLECLPGTMADGDLAELESVIEHGTPAHAGTHLFRQGDEFEYIAIVRLGTVKTYSVDREGREHTLGFHMPGDMIGMDAIDEQRHPCSAVALDTVMLCKLPFRVVAELAARTPMLQNKLFRLMSRDIVRAAQQSGNHAADERLAAFLVGIADRLGARGYSATRCQLAMSRMEMASYLRLAPETLSRLLRRFQEEGLVSVEGRDVELRERARLQEMAAPLLPC
ncbi:MAG TPA: cyclic nucleotide-binding domain-containing protein [Stenotrophomonas sp.]|nr:cyclic nucleotide-binding domain-containing protein [Stenotrophomonas sp.]